jgi:hypothetical protein
MKMKTEKFGIFLEARIRVTRLGEFSPTYWAIVYFGQLFENYKSSAHFGLFFQRASYICVSFD